MSFNRLFPVVLGRVQIVFLSIFAMGLFILFSGIWWLPGKGIYHAQSLTFLMVGAFFILLLYKESWSCFCQPLVQFLLLIIIYSMIINFFIDPEKLLKLTKINLYILVFVCGSSVFFTRFKYVNNLLVLSIAVAAIFVLLALIMNIWNDPHFLHYRGARMANGWWGLGNYGYPTLMGMALGGLLVLTIGLWYENKLPAFVFVFAFVIFLVAVVLTYTRNAWISSGLVGLALSFYNWKHAKVRIFVTIFSIVLILFIVFNWHHIVLEFTQHELSGRTSVWKTCIPRIFTHPFFGHSAFANCSNFHPGAINFSHIHSIYLDMLYKFGIFGFILFIIFVIYILRVFIVNLHKSLARLGLAIFVYGLIIMSVDLSNLLSRPEGVIWLVFWVPVGMAVALESHHKRDKHA